MLDDNIVSLQEALKDLRQCITDREMDKIKGWQELIVSLEVEARTIRQIPTWPWQPEAPRTVIATILIPIGIWLIQKVLAPALP